MSIDPQHQHPPLEGWRKWLYLLRVVLRVLLAIFFVTAGVLHFVNSGFFEQIVPPYLPWPLEIVYISGVFEILGGCGILIPRLRRAAGWGLIALLIAVFPANLHMAINDVYVNGKATPPLLLWLRLPMQLVFIVWVWWCADLRRSIQPGV
jgi:uncharacterized membrane protein